MIFPFHSSKPHRHHHTKPLRKSHPTLQKKNTCTAIKKITFFWPSFTLFLGCSSFRNFPSTSSCFCHFHFCNLSSLPPKLSQVYSHPFYDCCSLSLFTCVRLRLLYLMNFLVFFILFTVIVVAYMVECMLDAVVCYLLCGVGGERKMSLGMYKRKRSLVNKKKIKL